jgi:DNA polymerase-3 subunit delta
MTPDELRGELREGRIRPAYLLAGEEPLLREDARAAIRAAVLAGAPADFDCDRLDGESASGGALVDCLRTLPVLAPRRLVDLRDPAAGRGRDRGLADALAAAVPGLEEGGPVVLVVSAAPDRVQAFREPAAVVDCEAPRGAREIAGFARAEAKRRGIELGPGVAELLAERVGPQLLVLRQELEKAALCAGPGSRVTRAHVEAGTADLSEEPVWELTDAIGEGRCGDALALLAKLRRAGAQPPVLLGALAGHFRRLLRVASGQGVPGPAFVRRKLESQARRYGAHRLGACLGHIHATDGALKGEGGLPPELALERLVIGLSG